MKMLVLIPLNSGLVFEQRTDAPRHQRQVLIPLNSGLVFEPETYEAVCAEYRLNPFEFRAGI